MIRIPNRQGAKNAEHETGHAETGCRILKSQEGRGAVLGSERESPLPSRPQYARIVPLVNYENRQCGLRVTNAVMAEGGVIRSDGVRHPFAPLHPASRAGLLRLARELDLAALKWGK